MKQSTLRHTALLLHSYLGKSPSTYSEVLQKARVCSFQQKFNFRLGLQTCIKCFPIPLACEIRVDRNGAIGSTHRSNFLTVHRSSICFAALSLIKIPLIWFFTPTWPVQFNLSDLGRNEIGCSLPLMRTSAWT